MDRFREARGQLRQAVEACEDAGAPPASRVVQLGDLGGYEHSPGSRECFSVAAEFLAGFGPVPRALVVGNHDLEGAEFESDSENLAAWVEAFGQRHFWAAELGPLVCLGLSTVRFRSNEFSVHEVHIDEEQMQFLEAAMAAAAGRPVAMFTHAPPLGSGLKVLQEVHVKNRCAWLNHSSKAGAFISLVHRYPNIRLWFSGHFHLSHNYADSIAVAGHCAFVQTGVIGDCNRDGFRHSRVLKGDAGGYRLYTLDHDLGTLRLDLQAGWADTAPPRPLLPPHPLLRDPPAQGGWLCSQLHCDLPAPRLQPAMDSPADSTAFYGGEGPGARVATNVAAEHSASNGASPGASNGVRVGNAADASAGGAGPGSAAGAGGVTADAAWFAGGGNCLLARHGPLLVEYDAAMRAPIGVVFMGMGADEGVVLVDAVGRAVACNGRSGGADAVAVELRTPDGAVTRRQERNERGGFFAIFQYNKWRARKQRLAEAARIAAPVPT
ncbi:hypothetical protein WJX81_000388 [Elliptochloris bilobata]|uniref:Calcineurin-like phosphoesterase domain-containing protein n=1 Tax=Elliptochloris bilobata TaxID=381761 RepID=A0AAW1QYW6_9CHLO